MFDLVSREDMFDGISSAFAKFGDGGVGKAWRDLKVSEQEVPKSVRALEEMPIRTARDEHQTLVVSSSSVDDVNMSPHSALPQARSNASSASASPSAHEQLSWR